MKKKIGITGRILCFALVLFIAVQTASLAVAGAGAGLVSSPSTESVDQDAVLPDADNGQWEIPTAQENPNTVDMTINNGIVYNDYVYEKLKAWEYTNGYHSDNDTLTIYWRDFTASLGPLAALTNYKWHAGKNGNWIHNPYLTTAVRRNNGEYGIHKNLVTPTLSLGGRLNIVSGYISRSDVEAMAIASRANWEQADMRIGAKGSADAYIAYTDHEYSGSTPLYVFRPNGAGEINADINLIDYYKNDNTRSFPAIRFSVDSESSDMSGIHVVFIDNTSPSVQNVDVSQEGDQLVVKLTTNEGVRWSSSLVEGDLDDIWIEVDVQVVGTDYTQTVRAHVSGIINRYMANRFYPDQSDFTNEIIFKGDLGAFAGMDYKVLDISGVNMPKKDYPITFGKMLMIANQTNDSRIRSDTLGKWDAKNKVTVYETYNTSAICDIAGNPINLESVVNWPINQKEIKNKATFVRKIELINEKVLLGGDMSKADSFMEDVSRAEYFFGPEDEIAPRLFLNRVLTDEEVASFRVKTSVKDRNGEYVWLGAKGTGKYSIRQEEFMYIDFEPLTLKSDMTYDFQVGNRGYFEILEVECKTDEAYPFTPNIPSAEKTLYIDLDPPEVSVKSNSPSSPELKDGYYSLDIEINIKDKMIDSTLQAGVLEQDAYFRLSGNVNEATPIKFVVNTTATPPETVDGYTGSAKLYPDGNIKLNEKPMGMTSNAENKVYVHLLIPEKSNLLIKGFTLYADVSDTVGNTSDAGYEIDCRIDRQRPEISVSSISSAYTADSAISTVKVEATDYNNVESVSYQWVEAGKAYDDSAWESAIIDPAPKVMATVTKQFGGTATAAYDMVLYLKCKDNKGNESIIIQKEIKINIEKPSVSYEVKSDIIVPSAHPEVVITGPERSTSGKTGYTRVTVSPLSPRADWAYVTVVESGEQIDLFTLDSTQGNKWYKVALSGSLYTAVQEVDGETVTLDDLKKYYGNLKISFENAYMDLTPVIGYLDDTVTDGSYIADQNFITARFASQDGEISSVNATNFGKVTDRNGSVISENGDSGEKSLLFGTGLRGVNTMSGVTLYFDITNIKMSDWGLLDIDFANSKVELLWSDKETTDKVIYTQMGLAQSGEQHFTIPACAADGSWFKTGVYRIRVTVKSNSGSVDFAESLNLVYDAGVPRNYGLVSYSHDLRYETGAYRTMYSGDPVDSFGIAIQPGMEAHRNNVFAIYTGGVTGFSFAIGADNTTEVYDGYTVGAVEGFRYWNSLSAPSAEDLENYDFRLYDNIAEGADPFITVTSGVSSIYTEETIPKGAEGLGDIYLVEGVNVICYQVKMENGYVSPVKQFTIVVTQYIPEFNVIVEDYTPSYEAAQRDGQVNAHDITVRIEEAFSLNGSGNVNVEIWSNYSMEVNGEWVAQSEENSLTADLTCLTSGLKAGDTAVLTENSYTTCFPPYSGQGNYCSAVFAAIDEYGGMVVFAPQIGDLRRVQTDALSDLWAIEYYGDAQDDPFTIGYDTSFIMIYNQPVYFGEKLVGFQNLMSKAWGPYEKVESSIPELEYNLFAIRSNSVEFSSHEAAWSGDRKTTSATWNTSSDVWKEAESKIKNYSLIDWDNTTISFYDADGNLLAQGLNVKNPGANAAGFIGSSFGEVYEPAWNGSAERRYMQFSLRFANPMADEEHPAYDWDKNSWDEANASSKMPISFKMEGINILGDRFETEGSLDLRYIDYSAVGQSMTGSGIVLNLPFATQGGAKPIYTGLFNGAGEAYSLKVTDAYGVDHTIEGTYNPDLNFDIGTSIVYSDLEMTSKPVEITISRIDGKKIYVDVTDAEIISVEGNGSANVKLTVTDSITFTYKYIDDELNEISRELVVSNIVKPNPRINVDVDTSNVLVDEDGTVYRYGNVVITLVDDVFTLTDIYTGKEPRFTFTPGGATSYVFSKDEIIASLGEEEGMEIPASLSYSIDFELREVIDPLAEITVSDAPSVKINAFKEDRGYYRDEGLALILEPSGIGDSIVENEGDTVMKYAGKRVNASAFLEKLGWGSAYRFLAEISFGGAYKTFIKQGIYTEAPDYESGKSDAIDGVTLNGRLISVEKNTPFTFFVVAKNGNYTSVVFDVKEIGDAPVPGIVKVPIDDKSVKVYIMKPENVTDFVVKPADINVQVKSDTSGDYKDVPYVIYDKNDDYIINYSFTFEGEAVQGNIDASIYEIRSREMRQDGMISWSANKVLEATDKDVSATLSFSETVSSVEVIGGNIDKSKVSITSFGRQVSVVFSDNHEGFTLKVKSAYGDVVITLDGVDNIDREAPDVREISRELSQDGKKVTITLATSEMTVFREGGYIGEKTNDKDGKEIFLYVREISANGSYTYHFTDMSGIETSITVKIDEIVTDALGVFFSTDKNIDNAVTDASSLVLEAGDKVYVLATRDATVYYNGGEGVGVKKDEWLEIVLDDGVGGAAPYVTVTDEYGSVVIRQFSQIIPKDTEAPIIVLQKSVITVVAGSDRKEVEKILLSNVHANDKDENLTYSVEFTSDISASGSFTATYTVTDSSGNAAKAECKLRVVSGAEPKVSVNGSAVDREGTYYAESGAELTLTVDVSGQPYCVYIESGIKTVAQMKIGSTDITDGYVKDATVSVGKLESGYHTLIVQTQSRDYFRIIIYVY